MGSNKDEATRARDSAKRKFLANDVSAARKFALKAQSLCPDLDGISQMVATFDVHLSARKIINMEIDYYGVLGLNPEADDDTVRKRYRKLAVMLHPDRNKSVGAEEAFKYLSQAWAVFSDKAKRGEYDKKMNPGSASSSKPANNGSQKVAKVKTTKRAVKGRVSNGSAAAAASTSTAIPEGTFWTVCSTCKTQYEYHRKYVKQNLLCPSCHVPFIAVETDPPGSGTIRKAFHEHHSTTDGRKRSATARDINNGMSLEFESYERTGGAFTGSKPTVPTGSKKDEVARREYTKRAGGVPPPKRRKGTENGVAAGGSNVANPFAAKSNSVKELSEEELNNLMKKKAKPLISKMLQELRNLDVNVTGMETEIQNAVEEKVLKSWGDLTLDVPEPDFCDFDKDRTEKSIRDNQIWAVYDSTDGMPRSYVMVQKVISVEPFKASVVPLTSETNNELRSTKWLGFGIPKSCGEFKAGKTEICKSAYVFSHKVTQFKGKSGVFAIYPQKGEVWALYRDWSSDWNYLTGGKTVEYEVVEVVEGGMEDYGVSVVPLAKVAGYESVFKHHVDPLEIRGIPREEMSRFSHRIPSYLLTRQETTASQEESDGEEVTEAQEASNALGGCIQLDPAAIPSHLLKIIVEY